MKFLTCNCEIRQCKHFQGKRKLFRAPKIDGQYQEVYYCNAYRYGIPEEIAFGNNEHLEKRTDQNNPLVYGRGPDLKMIKPYQVRHMEDRKLHGRDNLCSTIRDIYINSTDPEIQLWCRIAMRMAKNMYRALTDYKDMLVEAGLPVGHDSREDWQVRKKNLYREKEIQSK